MKVTFFFTFIDTENAYIRKAEKQYKKNVSLMLREIVIRRQQHIDITVSYND